MHDHIQQWENGLGSKFLLGIGLKQKQSILDFGCGQGDYTISAAIVTGYQ